MSKTLFIYICLLKIILSDHNPIFLNETYNTGFIKIREVNEIFYWHFESRTSPQADPLVFWLTGGPGCSSIIALFTENGPYQINEDLSLQSNPYSWNEISNIVFVDQPVGTGYSKASQNSYAKNEQDIANDFMEFLEGFYQVFPQYKNRKLIISGESYAGHYIPAIGAKLLRDKKDYMNFMGIIIGSGWVDPYNQYPEYANFAYENNLIGEIKYYLLKQVFKVCQKLIQNKQVNKLTIKECQLGVDSIIGFNEKKFNQFDIRRKCISLPFCYGPTNMADFLARQDVIQALGLQGRKWEECSEIVQNYLQEDQLISLSKEISFIIENKINVLIYSGDKDFVCNWRGGEKWTNEVKWNQQENFQNTQYIKWGSWGEYKHVDNFLFLRIYDAGHQVPMDQPESALNMLKSFLKEWTQKIK